MSISKSNSCFSVFYGGNVKLNLFINIKYYYDILNNDTKLLYTFELHISTTLLPRLFPIHIGLYVFTLLFCLTLPTSLSIESNILRENIFFLLYKQF